MTDDNLTTEEVLETVKEHFQPLLVEMTQTACVTGQIAQILTGFFPTVDVNGSERFIDVCLPKVDGGVDRFRLSVDMIKD